MDDCEEFSADGEIFLSPCLQLQGGAYPESMEVVGSWKILNF
jgi:hypothetical protein